MLNMQLMLPAATEAIETASQSTPLHELTPLHDHQLLVFWVQLLVITAIARFFGYVVFRAKLPTVIGHLLAGVVLGPSVFGKIWPDGFNWFIPEEAISSGALFAVTWIGVALLLVTAGFETDLNLIRRLGKAALLVTGFSLIVPLIGGLLTGLALPDVFVASGADHNVFAMFIAAALSVSALAVIARILSELGLMRRDFGQITIAAGMANDVVGWMMLSVFAGFAAGGVSFSSVTKTIVGLSLFLVLAMTIGQRIVDYCLRQVLRIGVGIPAAVSVAIFTMLTFGVITQSLGIEAVLGAFVAGVVLNRSRFQQQEVLHHIESLTNSFLAPVFFAIAGMRVDLALLAEREALVGAVVIVAVALVTKFVGSFVGAKLARLSNRLAAALGAGLNARGALEIVIASVGLSTGVFSDTAYTVIVIMPLITSLFAAVTLQVIVRDWRGTADELERLEREEELVRNLVVRSDRLMLVSRANPASIAASQIVHFAWPDEVPVTVVSVNAESKDDATSSALDITVLRNVFDEREVDHNILRSDNVARAIAEESQLGYGMICLGVSGEERESRLYSPMVDELLLQAKLPVLIVRKARGLTTPLPPAFVRMVVPVTGTRSSRAAQEIALGISSELGTEVVLTHVVAVHGLQLENPLRRLGKQVSQVKNSEVTDRHGVEFNEATTRIVKSLIGTASDFFGQKGITPVVHLRKSASPALALVEAITEVEADLVVLGASLRQVNGRPFLGQTVETILEHCDANIVVVAMPYAGHSE